MNAGIKQTRAYLKAGLRTCWLCSRPLTTTVRRWLAARLQSLPVNSMILGPPKGIHTADQEGDVRCRETSFQHLSYRYTKIFASQEIHRAAPKTIHQHIHWEFNQQYHQQSPETFLVEIEDGRFCVDRQGKFYTAVITADDQVISDISTGFVSSFHLILSELKLPKIEEIHGSVVIVSDASDGNYFHWLFDSLPRLYLLQTVGIDLDEISHIGIVSGNLPFHTTTLELLGIDTRKIIELRKSPHIKAKRLLVPSFPGISGRPPKWACEFLRIQFLPHARRPPANSSRWIYISRNHAKYRRVENELEIIHNLKALGFEVVNLEELSIPEQIGLFATAEVIIAPHGAGLANLVFCQPGTKIIELFSSRYVNVCYWALSEQIGGEYYYLLEKEESIRNTLDVYEYRKNITVDLTLFKKTLAKAGIL